MCPEQQNEDDLPQIFGLEAFRQPAESPGISLDQLSAAFAEMLSEGDDPYQPAAEEEPPAETDAGAPPNLGTPEDLADEDATEISPRTILEAMLFVGTPHNEPLTSVQVAGLMRGVRPAEIDALVEELNQSYRDRGCPYQIISEGAGYRLSLRSEFERTRAKFYGKARQARLSQSTIEVLAAVAYRGPLSVDEIGKLRGAPAGSLVNQLVRRQLLKLERRDASSPAQYRVTQRFLDLFGLESLEELPQSQELTDPSL